MRAVVFDFTGSRGGQHVREFLVLPGNERTPGWKGKLVTDDFSGCKACFELGVTEVGCMAHGRRKFHELWANHASPIGEQALKFFIQLYEIERELRELLAGERQLIKQNKSRAIADALQQWLTQQRQKVPDSSATARAIDYSLKRWKALVRFIDDGELPIENNWVKNQIRPIAIGRSNWLFAGSLRAGKRAAAVMSLVHSARLNGHNPLRVPARRARALANAAGPSDHRPAAASLASTVISGLENIAALVEGGGEVTLGRLDAIGKCVATACDDAQCLAMLVRREGDALLKRLDAAINDAYQNERFIDEVNAPIASGPRKPHR
jgi:hypothetical protein